MVGLHVREERARSILWQRALELLDEASLDQDDPDHGQETQTQRDGRRARIRGRPGQRGQAVPQGQRQAKSRGAPRDVLQDPRGDPQDSREHRDPDAEERAVASSVGLPPGCDEQRADEHDPTGHAQPAGRRQGLDTRVQDARGWHTIDRRQRQQREGQRHAAAERQATQEGAGREAELQLVADELERPHEDAGHGRAGERAHEASRESQGSHQAEIQHNTSRGRTPSARRTAMDAVRSATSRRTIPATPAPPG